MVRVCDHDHVPHLLDGAAVRRHTRDGNFDLTNNLTTSIAAADTQLSAGLLRALLCADTRSLSR